MSEAHERLKEALAGRYAIEREIGSGGMATVYLALDLKHRRRVAVKVLRPELTATIGTQRFLHEIEIAAKLQHPNILPLLDSGDSDGFLYYVMPFIEGQTLRERLRREGELPVPVAVKLVAEVVDALAEAHRHGVIHRDIKPENVLLTGRHAMVADFGVAKAVKEATGPQHLTAGGVALGTPAYMAPEQASAEPNLDHRVDLYAVGVMAYELLTGHLPFAGSSAQQILAAHLTPTPKPITLERPSVPAALEAVVMKCLARRPADRWQSAEELLAQLEPILATLSGGVTPADTRRAAHEKPAVPGRRPMLLFGGAAAVFLVAIAAALWSGNSEEGIEFGPVKPVTTDPGLEIQPAISPDGKLLAYVAGPIGQLRVYVRSVSGGTPIPVAKDLATEQQIPRWSPDGVRLLFYALDAIYTAPALGGPPRVVVSAARQPAWSPDGKEIAYVTGDTLFARALSGGTPRKLYTGLDLHSPTWSPNGRFIAFVVGDAGYWVGNPSLGNLSSSTLLLVPAAGGKPITLSNRKFMHTSPVWMPDSRRVLLMSTQDGGRDIYVLAITRGGRPRGAAVRLTTGLEIGTFSLSADGRQLAYSSFENTSNLWSIPIPSMGILTEAAARPVTTGTQHIEAMGVSRDGKWLAFDSDRQGNTDIYRIPITGGAPQQVTTDPSFDFAPSWSPDGKEIVFHTWRNETRDVYVAPAGGGEELMVAGGPANERYADWSPDGQRVVFDSDRTGRRELYIVSRGPDGKWQEPRQLTFEGGYPARWSPDGRGIVYVSGSALLVIRPEGGSPRAMLDAANWSEAQGFPTHAVWSPDARTIYFKAVDWTGRASFWAIPAQGGKPRLLVRFDDPAFGSARQEFATDGKRLYFTVTDRQSDITVMEVRPRR